MRSKEFAQKRRRRRDVPLEEHKKSCCRWRQVNLLDGSELGENGPRLRRWTEIPNVFLIHGRLGTAFDEGINPTEGNPLEDGDIVFWRILDGLDAYMQISGM